MTLKKGDKVAFMVLGRMVEGNIIYVKERKRYDKDILHNKYWIEYNSSLFGRMDSEILVESDEFYSTILKLWG